MSLKVLLSLKVQTIITQLRGKTAHTPTHGHTDPVFGKHGNMDGAEKPCNSEKFKRLLELLAQALSRVFASQSATPNSLSLPEWLVEGMPPAYLLLE